MEPLDNIKNQMPVAPDVNNQNMFSEGRIDSNPEIYPDVNMDMNIPQPKKSGKFVRKNKNKENAEDGMQNQPQQPQQPQQFPQQSQPQQHQQPQQQAMRGNPFGTLLGGIIIVICALVVPMLVGSTIYKLLVSDSAEANRPSAILEARGLSELEKKALLDDVLLRAKVASPVSVEITEEDAKVLLEKLTWVYDSETKVKESSLKDGSRVYLRGLELVYIMVEK